MTALDAIHRRSLPAEGFVAPRSGDVAVAAAGLERMRRLVEALGNPQRAYRTFHVAGSKGKGSTVAYAAAILTATGRTTGRYTSPHLMDWRERIAVDGVDISKADFDRVVDYVDSTMARLEAERPGDAPHNAFELLTAAAFVHFAEVGCDAAVIEVGIGGRFDSTNVIDSDVAVITSIEAEHLDILGPTLADVACNKAGIMRPGKPCVALPQSPIVAEVIEREAEIVGARLLQAGGEWSWEGDAAAFRVAVGEATFDRLSVANPTWSNLANASAAVVAATVLVGPTRGQIATGLRRGTLVGRFELAGDDGPVVLDVAHTRDSLAGLGIAAGETFPGRRLAALLGVLDDKDLDAVCAAVAGWAEAVVATTAPSPRAHSSSAMARAFADGHRAITDEPDPDRAFIEARRLAGDDGVVVVTGSFALVAHVRRQLLGEPS